MTAPTRFTRDRILVIDDEARLTESLVSLLKGAGYHVEGAHSGPEGLEKIRSGRFDLVITDLRMEEVDGFDIMNHVADRPDQPALIVITGHASTRSAIEALHKRAADYITKPFDFDVLRASIERVFAYRETERLRQQLISMLTHDIKVPLTNILGFAQLIATDESLSREKTVNFAETIALNCQKLLLMLENYLMNARIEEGLLETSIAPVDLHDLIEECLSMMFHEFEKKGILVELDLDDVSPRFTADGTLIGRAVNNLLNNAAKYTPRGESVSCSCRTAGEFIEIVVSNTGASLTPEEAAGVFERYRRAGTSAGVEGSGLGLHIVKCIAEAHSGDACCEVDGERVTFTLRLPVLMAGK